jgi:hypothetical protein
MGIPTTLWQGRACLICFLAMASAFGWAQMEGVLSAGRTPDPTAKTLSELRAAERRRIPLEVLLKTASRHDGGGPVEVTIIITNLFDAPLLMNSRMLVNHPRLQGELSFRITDPSGNRVEIQRLITPLSVRDEDFVTLTRGESMQRTVDLADLFGMTQKGVYKVQVCYHNEIDYRGQFLRAWKGTVWSEPVEIQID